MKQPPTKPPTRKEPLRVLIISSHGPSHSAGLGSDLRHGLRALGCEVDYVSAFAAAGDPAGESDTVALKPDEPSLRRAIRRKRRWSPVYRWHRWLEKHRGDSGHCSLMIEDERHPGVPPSWWLRAIPRKEYDLIVTLFWYDLISAATVAMLRKSYGCPVHILAVDMHPVTGGCFYFGDCRGFESGCHNCHMERKGALRRHAAINQAYKRLVYADPGVYLHGNSYMLSFFRRSGVIAPERLRLSFPPLDEENFCIRDRRASLRALGLEEHAGKRIIFAGAQNVGEPRKGFSAFRDAVQRYASDNPDEATRTVVLLAGHVIPDLGLPDRMQVVSLGWLDRDRLVDAYNVAHVYVSPSIDDAGPTMVPQALLCGTPVAAFRIGAALDLLTPTSDEPAVGSTPVGFAALTGDSADLAHAISRCIKLSADDPSTPGRCRAAAVALCSRTACAKTLL